MPITTLNSQAIPADVIQSSDLDYPLTDFSSTGIDDNATSTAITIDASENVGIGITSPNALLHVSSSGNGEIEVERVGGALINLQAQSAVGVIGTDSNHDLRFKTNGSVRASITSAGNVGIGTTSPTHDLTVGSTSAADYVIALRGGVGGFLGWDDSANTTILQAPNTRSLSFRVNSDTFSAGTEAMRISSAGNVGINQSAPDAQLTLNPPNYTSTATGGMIKWKNSNNSGHSNIQSYFVSGQGTDINIGANAYINTSGGWSRWSSGLATSAISCRRDGTIAFITNASSGDGITRAVITSSGNVLIGRTSTPSGIQAGSLCINFDIHHQDAAGNDRLLYDRSANLLGNTGTNGAFNAVGIGTTSPQYELSFGTGYFGLNYSTGKLALYQANSTSHSTAVESIGSVEISSSITGSGAGAIKFNTLGSERMRISSAGNVGIGTASPAKPLHVKLATNENVVIQTGGSGDTRISAINDAFTTTTQFSVQGDPLLFRTFGGGEMARIDSSGALFVGATSASSSATGVKIQPNGYGGVSAAVNIVGSSSGSSNSGFSQYSTGAGAYRFYVDYTGTIFATSTSITGISDVSLKENVRDLDKGLDTINALQPRRFDWKNGDGNDMMGFIAQEVEEVMPELVHEYKYTDEENKKGLKMGDMVPSMVKAIQELSAQVNELKAEVAALKGA